MSLNLEIYKKKIFHKTGKFDCEVSENPKSKLFQQ